MPDVYKSDSATEAYRKYYAYKTTYMKVNWKLEERIPNWWNESFINEAVNLYNVENVS